METLADGNILMNCFTSCLRWSSSVPLYNLFLYLDIKRAGGGLFFTLRSVQLSSFGGSANSLLISVWLLLRDLKFESRIPSGGIQSAFCKHNLWKIFQQINRCASRVVLCDLTVPLTYPTDLFKSALILFFSLKKVLHTNKWIILLKNVFKNKYTHTWDIGSLKAMITDIKVQLNTGIYTSKKVEPRRTPTFYVNMKRKVFQKIALDEHLSLAKLC